MPLRLRLTLVFSLAAALVIGFAGVVFVAQLRDDLYDALDTGLATRLTAAYQELASDPTLRGPWLRPSDQPILVQGLDGTVLGSNPSAAGWSLSPQLRRSALVADVYFTAGVGGRRIRAMASRARLPGGVAVLAVGVDTDVADDATERVRSALLLGGPFAVLVIGVGAWILAEAALRPVAQMRMEASSIGEHDTERRLVVPDSGDEIAALGSTMNRLLDRMHAALDRERRFVGDASRELRTPLAVLRRELELAGRPGRSVESMCTAITKTGRETERLAQLTEDLLLLARVDNHQTILRHTCFDLRELLVSAVTRARLGGRQPPVEVDCPAGLRVVADESKLLQVVDNLLSNAVVHTPEDTAILVRAARDEDGFTAIEVIDDGPGLPLEFQPRAFDRFQRAGPAASGGSGLGLSIVRAVAEAHGGTADIDNRSEGGTCAGIRLPPQCCPAVAGQSR